MSKSIEVKLNPDLLIWARTSAGFTKEEVALKLKFKIEDINNWETGNSFPSLSQLRKLGETYKRPLAVFLLPERPFDFQPLKDFRKLPDSLVIKNTAAFNFEIRKSFTRRQIALDIYEDLDEQPKEFNHIISISDDPEEVGLKIRDFLEITYEKQIHWKDDYEALNAWRTAIEKIGVLVFQSTGVSVKEMRGFAINEYPLPVITINNKDTPKGRIFTLLHELAHLMLRDSGICNLKEEQNIEKFCNHIAGSAIIPLRNLINESVVLLGRGKYQWSNDELSILSSKYRASKEAILRRLLICGLTTESFYRLKRLEFSKEVPPPKGKKDIRIPISRKIISNTGLSFVSLILDGYYQKKITLGDISDYLGMRLKHFPKIEKIVNSKIGV